MKLDWKMFGGTKEQKEIILCLLACSARVYVCVVCVGREGGRGREGEGRLDL